MAETDASAPPPPAPRRPSRRFPLGIAALVALGAVNAAAWFYFRKAQPVTDELTRDRLQSRGGPRA